MNLIEKTLLQRLRVRYWDQISVTLKRPDDSDYRTGRRRIRARLILDKDAQVVDEILDEPKAYNQTVANMKEELLVELVRNMTEG